jgi:hypothetical protein
MADDSSNPKAIEMCETILKWLSDEGLYRDRVQDENLYFHLAAEFPAQKSCRHGGGFFQNQAGRGAQQRFEGPS